MNIVVCLFLFMALLGAASCRKYDVSCEYKYDDEGYSCKSKATFTGIKALEIDYPLGRITIGNTKEESITIKETVDKNTEDPYKMHYLFKDDKLTIKFASSHDLLEYAYTLKNLEIMLPCDTALALKIKTTSAAVFVKDVTCKSLAFSGKNSSLEVKNATFDKIDVVKEDGYLMLVGVKIKENNIRQPKGNIGLSYEVLPETLNIKEGKDLTCLFYVFAKDAMQIKVNDECNVITKYDFAKEGNIYTFSKPIHKYEFTCNTLKIIKKK